MGFFQSLYSVSPVWVQNAGISIYGILWYRRRFGGVFNVETDAFRERESFSQAQWADYQAQSLRSLLKRAYEKIPYYQSAFSARGFSCQDFRKMNLEDLARLPILEKDLIRKKSKELLVKKSFFSRGNPYLTSGTTGTPMTIYFSDEMHQKWSAAYEARCRNWAGVHREMKRVMIGGRLVVPKANAKPPFWRYNAAEKQLYMSAFHISPENTAAYVSAINYFKPDYLVGYASAHFFLARMIQEQNLQVHQPKAILTSSEKLTDEMRQTMESVYGCKVFDAYSGVEACCLASECEHHRMHVSPDVGIVELINEKGNAVKPGEMGEIVATGLLNEDQPLIRYRTGDYAVFLDEKCPCGREMPVIKELVGRLEDTVIAKDGRETVRFHGIFVGIAKIREGQIIQETLEDFILRLVVESKLSEAEMALVQKRFDERLGKINLQIQYVDKIERTERGKYRAVISKVSRITNR